LSEARRNGRIAEGHKRLTWPLNTLSFALIGLAALLAPGFNRRGPWPRVLTAIGGVVAVQALVMALGSLTEQHLALIPLLYVAAIAPSVICLAAIIGVWPRRRTVAAAPA
jgi:lipopolysaccharide export system permease protein